MEKLFRCLCHMPTPLCGSSSGCCSCLTAGKKSSAGSVASRRSRSRFSPSISILGISLWFGGLNPEVLSVIERSSLGKTLGRERMHFNLELAVAKYLADPANIVLNAKALA